MNQNGTTTFNSAFTFPSVDGTAGQVLETNGSGTVTWEAGGGTFGAWISMTVSSPCTGNLQCRSEPGGVIRIRTTGGLTCGVINGGSYLQIGPSGACPLGTPPTHTIGTVSTGNLHACTLFINTGGSVFVGCERTINELIYVAHDFSTI